MKLSKICDELELIAPTNMALSFDNVGLLVGDINSEIKSILIALDLTKDVLNDAIEKGVDMIITHHPLIFNPIKNITTNTINGEILISLIKNDISYYASHTNLDKSDVGTNMYLAEQLELNEYAFVDSDDLILVKGNKETTSSDLINDVKKILNLDYVRFVGDGKKEIKTVGVATGAGDSYGLFSFSKKNGVDILITGDLTYHTMQFANDIGLNLIDATHFGTENIIINKLKQLLDVKLDNVTVQTSKVQKNIFRTL